MKELSNFENIDELIKNSKILIIEFGSETCAPCHDIKNKLSNYTLNHPEISLKYISVDENRELSAQMGVFTSPTVTVYMDGVEIIRESGYFSLELLLQKLERYVAIAS